ncbi:MAG: tetratricopeptide repeat protein, partial [Burkholderiales bacterium]|nr:tetratricopeptide repeat protein [Burkholderiales bacterium]
TIWRNRDYAGEVAFWEATVRASPRKGRVWNNLGFARQQAGDLAGARTAYERAIELDPEDYRALTNLGTLEP